MHLTEERVQELENKLATARTLQVRRPPQPRAACHSWPCHALHRKSSSALLVLLNAEQGHALDVSTSALKVARGCAATCALLWPQEAAELNLQKEKEKAGNGQTVRELQSMTEVLEKEVQTMRGNASKRQGLLADVEAARKSSRAALAKLEVGALHCCSGSSPSGTIAVLDRRSIQCQVWQGGAQDQQPSRCTPVPQVQGGAFEHCGRGD